MNQIFFIKPINSILLLLFFTTIISCKKDLGNYTYNEINKVDISGIDPVYNVLLGEKFNIKPVLNFSSDPSKDEDNYTYDWVALKTDGTLPLEVRKNLATTKNLEIPITIPSGPYNVFYRVTDKKTGVMYQTSFKLNVQTSIYEGWLVLSDVDNNARLDMVSNVNGVFVNYTDVLGQVGSELKLLGKPLDVTCYSYMPNFYGIYVSTDKSTDKIEPETFKWINTYNLKYEVIGNTPSNFHADGFAQVTAGNNYMYAANNVYYYYSTFQMRYSTPINLVKGELLAFKASPFIASGLGAGSNATAILFDTEKKRFLRHVNNEGTSTLMPSGTSFDYNNVGKDLVYMEATTYNGSDAFAVLKDPSTLKSYLARISLKNAFIQNYFAEITGTDIDKAEQFAVSPEFGYLFYSVGGKIYEYDMVLKTSKLMLDKGTQKISLLKFHKFERSGATRPYNQTRIKNLMVASYNPALASDKNGTLEFYTVPPVNGNIVLAESFTGFGKIVSVSYRER